MAISKKIAYNVAAGEQPDKDNKDEKGGGKIKKGREANV